MRIKIADHVAFALEEEMGVLGRATHNAEEVLHVHHLHQCVQVGLFRLVEAQSAVETHQDILFLPMNFAQKKGVIVEDVDFIHAVKFF